MEIGKFIEISNSEDISIEELYEWSKSRTWWYREAVAFNFKTPGKLLARLAKDINWRVRKRVACNSNTPIENIKRLARDRNIEVCLAAIKNPKLPDDELSVLSNSKKQEVARAAKFELVCRRKHITLPDLIY